MHKIDTSWSQLLPTRLGRYAHGLHINPWHAYHNWSHISRLYHHAQHTFGFEYDANLDAAIMFHDSVYDALPDKELRSIDAFHTTYARVDPISVIDSDVVEGMIRSTITHEVIDDDRMILLDLADLMDPMMTIVNYGLLEEEAMELYGVTRMESAIGTKKFLTGMLDRMTDNMEKSVGDRLAHWYDICEGIERSIDLAQMIINDR